MSEQDNRHGTAPQDRQKKIAEQEFEELVSISNKVLGIQEEEAEADTGEEQDIIKEPIVFLGPISVLFGFLSISLGFLPFSITLLFAFIALSAASLQILSKLTEFSIVGATFACVGLIINVAAWLQDKDNIAEFGAHSVITIIALVIMLPTAAYYLYLQFKENYKK
ncbi:MAG: hypothetical protein FWB72_01800 [Firmicutes bacterium]|nr:hypothetical protein [Bacillota bacterium]